MFNLNRSFSIVSLSGIAIVIITSSIFYHDISVNTLVEHETQANVALATVFSNSIWSRYASFIKTASDIPINELAQHKTNAQLRADVLLHMRGLNVTKVQLYNLDGLTVFSTDPTQIGQNDIKNSGFLSARSGETISHLTHQNETDAFERIVSERNVISSYVPVFSSHSTQVSAVFVLTSDVTNLLQRMKLTQRKFIAGVLASLIFLFMYLYFIVKRADKLIKKQQRTQKKQFDKIQYQAYHDALTGLPNRTSFSERLEEAIKRARRSNSVLALMMLDLERFKLINDSLGQTAGDQLLQMVAERIRNSIREIDNIFRVGGDEFSVILENLDKVDNVVMIAERVYKALSEPFKLNDHEIMVGTSMGITVSKNGEADADVIVNQADAAMSDAKKSGSQRYHFYTESMNSKALERLTIQSELRQALAQGEFILYYQPKVLAESGQIIGMEALLRWAHPTKGLIGPNDFIFILEETGLINNVGQWVLRTACEQLRIWQKSGYPMVPVSVNISAHQFKNDNLVYLIKNILEETGLEPKYLELELTESLLVDNADKAIAVMHTLKELGIKLAIDDFGTGYSSLSYLRHLPVDFLKIDRSFINGLTKNEKDAAITKAISALAHSLNLNLVAEGVENKEQLEFLKKNGCTEVQGFLYSKPVPPEEFGQLISKGIIVEIHEADVVT